MGKKKNPNKNLSTFSSQGNYLLNSYNLVDYLSFVFLFIY